MSVRFQERKTKNFQNLLTVNWFCPANLWNRLNVDKTSDVMLYAIWYHLYNLENVKSTHEGVLLLVNFQAEASGAKNFNMDEIKNSVFKCSIYSIIFPANTVSQVTGLSVQYY